MDTLKTREEEIAFGGIAHIVFAIITYLLLFSFNSFFLVFVVVGSLFPDIDHPKSILGRYNPFAPFMKHRGLMHTVLVAIILTGIIMLWRLEYGLMFGFGYLTHLVGDTLTSRGVMWLYPINKTRYSIVKKS